MIASWRNHAEEGSVANVIQTLGQDLAQRRFDNAYDQLFSERFKARVDRERFNSTFDQMTRGTALGPIQSVQWNGRAIFDEEAGHMSVWAGSQIYFERPIDPLPRWEFRMSKIDGRWQIDDLPGVFPAQPRPRRGQR